MKKKIVSSLFLVATTLSMFAFAAVPMASAVSTAAPLVAGSSGADSIVQTRLLSIVETIKSIVRSAIPVVFALAIIYFFWGLAQYILNSGDTEGREEGKNRMIYGVLAIFVMVSVFGLVQLIGNTIGLDKLGGSGATYDINIPNVQVNW